jgi:hypothetical protein
MGETILRTLRETWDGYAALMGLAIPKLLVVAAILAVGALVAAVAQFLAVRVLRLLRFQAFSERTGAAELLRKAELPPAEQVAGSLVFWLLFAGFFFAALDTLGLPAVATLRDEIARLVPRAITSLAVLAGGVILAKLAWRVALLAAVNAGWRNARTASRLAYALVMTFVVAMAVHHLGVAREIVMAAFVMGFGSIALAVAIAVGIGAGPLVRRLFDEHRASQPRRDHDSGPHL